MPGVDNVCRPVIALGLVPRNHAGLEDVVEIISGMVQEPHTKLAPGNGTRRETGAAKLGSHHADRLCHKISLRIIVDPEPNHLFYFHEPV